MARKVKNIDRYGSRTSALEDKPIKAPDTSNVDVGSTPKLKAAPTSFGAAFRAARNEKGAGSTFTWNGKSYSTNMASDKPTTRSTPTRSEPPVKAVVAAAKAAPPPTSKPTPKYSASDFSGPKIGRGSPLDTAKVGIPRSLNPNSASMPKPSRPSVDDITSTDPYTGSKRVLSPDQKRKLQDAIDRSGDRMKKGGAVKKMARGGSIDGIAMRGKTRCKGAR